MFVSEEMKLGHGKFSFILADSINLVQYPCNLGVFNASEKQKKRYLFLFVR